MKKTSLAILVLALSVALWSQPQAARADNLTLTGPSSLEVGERGTWTGTYACTCTPVGNCSCELECGAEDEVNFKWYVMSADPVSPHQWVGPVRQRTKSSEGLSSVSDQYSTLMYSFDQYLKIRVDTTCGTKSDSKIKYVMCEDCDGGGGPV